MGAEVSRIVGVVVERRPAKSRWVDHVWRAVAVLDGAADAPPFTRLAVLADGTERYFAGNAEVTLHRTETEPYQVNLTGDRVLYIAFHPDAVGGRPALHKVTASPQEAADLLESNEELVEVVAMPGSIQAWVQSFCALHHMEEPFQKRKRKKAELEEEKFSQEPIFARAGRARTANPGQPDD